MSKKLLVGLYFLLVLGVAQAQQIAFELYQAAAKGDNSAFRRLRTSAERGDALAQYVLGYMYACGQGVPKDSGEAMKWFRKAADQGSASAQYAVGYLYENGAGVPNDKGEAKKWYGLAAGQGDNDAKKALAQLSEESPKIEGGTGIHGGSLLWADTGSDDYSLTVYNNRSEAIKNLFFEVIFHDRAGNRIGTDLLWNEGIIPAGLSKRMKSKVDLSIRKLTAWTDYRVAEFEIVR